MTTMTMRRTTKTSFERVRLGEDHSLGHRHGRVDSDDATTVSSTRRAFVRAFVDETSRRRRARRRDGATTKGATTNARRFESRRAMRTRRATMRTPKSSTARVERRGKIVEGVSRMSIVDEN